MLNRNGRIRMLLLACVLACPAAQAGGKKNDRPDPPDRPPQSEEEKRQGIPPEWRKPPNAKGGWKSPPEQRKPSETYIEYLREVEETGPDPEIEIQHYTHMLGLDDEQRGRVLKILEDRRDVYRKSHSLRMKFQEETRELERRIHELSSKFEVESRLIDGLQGNMLKKIRAALTGDQREIFDYMQEQRRIEEAEWRKAQEEEFRKGRTKPDDGQGRWGGGPLEPKGPGGPPGGGAGPKPAP
ncbi:MAG: hypothetical protein ABII00_00170 [Elusimicrobiota bacterium]